MKFRCIVLIWHFFLHLFKKFKRKLESKWNPPNDEFKPQVTWNVGHKRALNDLLIKGKLPTQFYTNCQFTIFMGSLWERERERCNSKLVTNIANGYQMAPFGIYVNLLKSSDSIKRDFYPSGGLNLQNTILTIWRLTATFSQKVKFSDSI